MKNQPTSGNNAKAVMFSFEEAEILKKYIDKMKKQ